MNIFDKPDGSLIFSVVFLLMPLMALVGCATVPAPEFSGRWKPVNRFASAPQAIALQPAYEYYATPLDSTLKAMLTRWASDTNLKLSYQAPMDYTLYRPVAQLRERDVLNAVARLNAVYAAQALAITVEGDQIVVREAGAETAAAPSSAP